MARLSLLEGIIKMRRRRLAVFMLVATHGLTFWTRPGSGAQASRVRLHITHNYLRLSNGIVEMALDQHNGYFCQIRNLVTHTDHKPPTDGVWPFGVWLGTREQPRQKVAEITADSPQPVKYDFRRSDTGGVLVLSYPDLVENATNQRTGVRLTVQIQLKERWDYFVLTARLENLGKLGLTNFYAAKGTQLTGDPSRAEEKVTTCFWGTVPREGMKDITRGSPTYSYGWYDYQGQRASIGMCYINHQGMMMLFDVAPRGDGIQQGWNMFDLKGYWHFEKLFAPERQSQIYPLEPGGEFSTDEWVIAPHQGDWHRMADIYRERYNLAFKGDYVNYVQSPQVAKDVYLVLATWLAVFKVYMLPEQFVEKVKSSMARLGVEPKEIGAMIHQGGTSWAKKGLLYCPDFFPLAPEIGGTEAVRQAIVELRKMGIREVMGYTYLHGNHPQARSYVPEADAVKWFPVFNLPAGDPPCDNNSAWMALWHDKITPQYKELGDNALYFDMGPELWEVCEGSGPTHLHGTGAVGVLTESRGEIRISKIIREGLGPDAATMMEGSQDVSGSWVDIWTAFNEPTLEYTFPDKLYWGATAFRQGLNDSLVYASVPLINFATPDAVTKALDSPAGDPQVLASLRRYLKLREELAGAPGHPDGYRDEVGLSFSRIQHTSNLVAKVYRRAGQGMTVVFYAKAPLQAELTVDGRALDNPNLGIQHKDFRLEKDEAGFWIIQPSNIARHNPDAKARSGRRSNSSANKGSFSSTVYVSRH